MILCLVVVLIHARLGLFMYILLVRLFASLVHFGVYCVLVIISRLLFSWFGL